MLLHHHLNTKYCWSERSVRTMAPAVVGRSIDRTGFRRRWPSSTAHVLSRECFQTICQRRVALPVGHPFDGKPDSFCGSYQDRKLLGTGESSIQQISTEQDIVLHEE